MLQRAFRGTIPANPEGVPGYASDSQRRRSCIQDIIDLEIAKVRLLFSARHYTGKNYIERLKPFHVRTNHVSKKNHTLPGHQRRADRKGTNFVNLRQAGDPVGAGAYLQ